MTPRGTDWSLALLVATGVATGLATWFAGAPESAWVFAGHAVAGASLAFVLVFKLRRVLPRLAPASGERRFTGSYDAGSFSGNDFPETSWVSDRPRPRAGPVDCTGGFSSTQRWRARRPSPRGQPTSRPRAGPGPAPPRRPLRVLSSEHPQ